MLTYIGELGHDGACCLWYNTAMEERDYKQDQAFLHHAEPEARREGPALEGAEGEERLPEALQELEAPGVSASLKTPAAPEPSEAPGPVEEEDCLSEYDFDSRYIWDEYKKVLYEALPEEENKGDGFGRWLALALCVLAVTLAIAGWLRGGKLLLPASGESQSILSTQGPQKEQAAPVEAAAPSGEEEAQPEAGASNYQATAILVNGKTAGILASQQAAYALVEEVKAHFSALAKEKGEGELTAELVKPVSYRSAEAGEEVESYESLFAKFTGSGSPLQVKCTITTESREEIGFKTSEEKDKYLLEGSSIVVSDGRPGAKVTITHTVYINGDKSTSRSGSETQTIKAQDRMIRVGTQEIDPEATPGKREGKEGPKTDLAFQSPLADANIAANYGQSKGVLHLGLDYAPKEGGSKDVLASCGGVVAAVMERGGYGLMIEIDHGEGFTTRYAHLDSASVALGDQVSAGQVIGQAGMSGNADSLHLHFELRQGGEAYNPRYYLD